MAILYLTEQQSWVGREGECLVIRIPDRNEESYGKRKRERKMTVPLFKVEEVVILGDITITTQAISSLLEAKVPLTYLTKHGRYLGSLSPVVTKNSMLRLAQHEAYAQIERRYILAQRFVLGKLRNMRTVLMRYHRLHPDPILQTHIESMKCCMAAAEQTKLETTMLMYEGQMDDDLVEMEPDEPLMGRMNGMGPLLGCEGAGSAAYFRAFPHLIRCGWPHKFVKRNRRPPTDPVNALLSYGYVILTAQVASVLPLVGFDPFVGYLHASRYGKPALALDVMEEFRPLIVDSVVLSLFNNHQIEANGFKKELNTCRMTDATKRLFLQKFEDRMQETIQHPIFEYKVSYRRCIELQARLLGKYLTGEIERYTPFAVR